MLEARLAVRNLKEYHPPLGGRIGLRLDFNENTRGTSPRVLERLRKLSSDQLARYPERAPIERITADFLGLNPREVLLTNGIDEAIHLLCQTYLEAGDEALVVVPTFAMYELMAAGAAAQVVSVPALSEFQFPSQRLLARINSATRFIAIANPNNPTGTVTNPTEILRVAHAATHAAVLVDEAYFEFYGQTLLSKIRTLPNLFVARTFSKAYGMAGLRVGVLVGPEEQLSMVRKCASPYNVNAVALACLPAALADQEFVECYTSQVRCGRERLGAKLRSLGIRYWPSQANFILANFGACTQSFVAAMSNRGILVRDRSSDPGCEGCVRITIATDQQMDRLLVTLDETIRAMPIGERPLA
jgi:histidinol-phosphate aminotransferase